MDAFLSSDSLFPLITLPSHQRLKLNRVLNTMQQRLSTAKTDMEDLLARLNQEVAVRQFLTTKRVLQKEKQRMEHANIANSKLLHECEILHNRLQECSNNFLGEEEDKLIVDTSSPSDAIDFLTTSDNRIGLLLAEAQLLAQDIEKSAKVDETSSTNGSDHWSDDELRKIVTDIFIDNARLRNVRQLSNSLCSKHLCKV